MAIWDNLTHYWTCDETSGDRADAVGTADLTGTIQSAAGKSDNAILSEDTAERMGTTSVVVDGVSDVSVACWFYFNGNGTHVVAQFTGWQIEIFNKTPRISVNGSGTNSWSSTVTENAWHLLVATLDEDASLKISIDGGALKTMTGSFPIIGSNLLNACKSAAASGPAIRVDELGIWDRLLDAIDVSDLWNGGAGEFYPAPVNPPAAVATWTVPAPDRIGAAEPAAALATWNAPAPDLPDVFSAAAATWTVPAPDRIGAAEPAAAVATWTLPAPDRIGAAEPFPAAGLWAVETLELIGTPPNAIRFGSVTLRSGGLSSVSLFQ